MIVTRIVPNVSSEAFDASRDFDAKLFDLEVSVELDDWYLQLKSASDPKVNIGLVQPGHELLAGDAAPSGTYGVVVTIQVDDVDEACRRAKRSGARDPGRVPQQEHGQRHFLVVDPNGLRLNIMSAI